MARFDPDDSNNAPERVRIGLSDTRLAEFVCFGRQTLPVAADFTAPYAVQNSPTNAGGLHPSA